MKSQSITLCGRCEGKFVNPSGGAASKAACTYCGFANVVTIQRSGNSGTARTADSIGDARAATSITVT